jgi:preprotein translocase subunit SecF
MRFIKYKWFYFGFSLLLLIPGLISLFRYGLRLSVDFTGGSLLEIQSSTKIPAEEFYTIAKSNNLELSTIQNLGEDAYLLRFKPLTQEENDGFKKVLSEKYPDIKENRFETVGPVVGAELARKALLSVVVASLFIIMYIAWSFRKIPKPYSSWKFGASAVIALLHDVAVILGLFSIFGHFFKVEIDSLFVTALLTVIGFSVHDTIVVFDRVRENLPKMPKSSFEAIVDFSLTETLARSLNTSLTVALTLTALLLFGGENIRWFVVALLIGIVSGTYSSIFNASPILVMWETSKKK